MKHINKNKEEGETKKTIGGIPKCMNIRGRGEKYTWGVGGGRKVSLAFAPTCQPNSN